MNAIIGFLMLCCSAADSTDNRYDHFHQSTHKWFEAWTLVYRNVFKLDTIEPVDFILFDDKYVYSTSRITVPAGKEINGCNLLNLQLNWRRALHNDTLTLPDHSKIRIGLMCFASATKEGKPYFLMPLPSFWQQAGIKSEELGLENMVTGVFLHEFSHTQQVKGLGERISAYEKELDNDWPFSDDIIQHLFGKDTAYLKLYTEEVNTLYQVSASVDTDPRLIKKGLSLMDQRHRQYLIPQHPHLPDIDKLFLTMEGFGQYTMYRWLIHEKGANLQEQKAIVGLRRGRKWWSQEQGFALFLVLERLQPASFWAKAMFSENAAKVTDLIGEHVSDEL